MGKLRETSHARYHGEFRSNTEVEASPVVSAVAKERVSESRSESGSPSGGLAERRGLVEDRRDEGQSSSSSAVLVERCRGGGTGPRLNSGLARGGM